MGEKADRIERHIEQERIDCQDNLMELKQRIGRTVDWRVQVGERPLTMMGLAFGGGVLLSALIGEVPRSRFPRPSSDEERMEVGTWGVLQAALVGVATTKLKSLVEELLPGFQEEYKRAAVGKRAF